MMATLGLDALYCLLFPDIMLPLTCNLVWLDPKSGFALGSKIKVTQNLGDFIGREQNFGLK